MYPSQRDNSQQRAVYGQFARTEVYQSVLKNTYLLLGLTLAFSAVCAMFSMSTNAPQLGIILTLVGVYGLMFLTYKLSNSAWGLLAVFAFTGFMGYTLGPLLNMVTHTFTNGNQIIMNAFGGTALIFFALSGYVLTTKKDFSFMGGFLMVGTIVALIAVIAGLFFHAPAMQLAISGLFVLLSSGWILWQTSEIIQGGETNYIRATIGLYVQLYNLFVSLIQLISAFSGDRD
jgi:modulator of FtsH protease